jgi:hypothetical protein
MGVGTQSLACCLEVVTKSEALTYVKKRWVHAPIWFRNAMQKEIHFGVLSTSGRKKVLSVRIVKFKGPDNHSGTQSGNAFCSRRTS